MIKLYDRISDPAAVLSLEPEELAGVLLEHLKEQINENPQRQTQRGSVLDSDATYEGYPSQARSSLQGALAEAWAWLEREGLLIPHPSAEGSRGWVRLSRRGEQLADREKLVAYRNANRLPRALLHGRIVATVWAPFLRGDYDVAVFQAFREVEIAVREAAGFPSDKYGTELMRQAFGAGCPLADSSAPESEQQARAHLFAGAIGSYKNATSHRRVTLQAGETIELLLFVSHLLRLVDEAAERNKGGRIE
jgi:uncharacterized protein (TIGR02391 family)